MYKNVITVVIKSDDYEFIIIHLAKIIITEINFNFSFYIRIWNLSSRRGSFSKRTQFLIRILYESKKATNYTMQKEYSRTCIQSIFELSKWCKLLHLATIVVLKHFASINYCAHRDREPHIYCWLSPSLLRITKILGMGFPPFKSNISFLNT